MPDPETVERIRDVDHLDDLLSTPPRFVVESLAKLGGGDVLVLGASGKMGPSLARMARRALDAAGLPGEVIGVARYSGGTDEGWLNAYGVRTVRCDLLAPDALEQLPDAPHIVYMAGRKFGSTGQEWLTWAVNVTLPALVARRFRGSRLVAFSTGNVYGLTPVDRGGSRETDPLDPRGEYAMSCLGRERVLEDASRRLGIPMAIIRLNYATEMRYGVIVDLAERVAAGQPVDLSMGHFNVIWQAHANAVALAALASVESPPLVLNVTGPETLSVRKTAEQLAEALGRPVTFTGREGDQALLSDSRRTWERLPPPTVDADRLIAWTADWVARGGASLGKPTHFEVLDGRY